MPLPTLEKTWQHSVNQTVTAQGTTLNTQRRSLRTIKNLMIGFATNPWTVRGSSNSTAAGMDSVDRWSADSDLVGNTAGSAHSWIVLRQTGIGSTSEICIDLQSTANSLLVTVFQSNTGFSGGSTTARPTAGDEIAISTTNSHWGGTLGSADQNVIVNVQQSTDGNCTRVFTFYQNFCTGFWIIDKPKAPRTGWSTPVISSIYSTGSVGVDVPIIANYFVHLAGRLKGRFSGAFSSEMSSLGTSSAGALLSQVINTVNAISGDLDFYDLYFYSLTASNVGTHGRFFDLWLGQVAPPNTADTYPSGGSKDFLQLGDFVVPWNGSTPVVA